MFSSSDQDRLYFPATERNRVPIGDALSEMLPEHGSDVRALGADALETRQVGGQLDVAHLSVLVHVAITEEVPAVQRAHEVKVLLAADARHRQQQRRRRQQQQQQQQQWPRDGGREAPTGATATAAAATAAAADAAAARSSILDPLLALRLSSLTVDGNEPDLRRLLQELRNGAARRVPAPQAAASAASAASQHVSSAAPAPPHYSNAGASSLAVRPAEAPLDAAAVAPEAAAAAAAVSPQDPGGGQPATAAGASASSRPSCAPLKKRRETAQSSPPSL